MAGLIRRGESGALTPRRSAWDPLEHMRELMQQWDPFRELGFARTYGQGAEGMVPSFEVKETKDSFVIRADLPGVKEQDLDITLQDNRLLISGQREEEKRDESDTYYTYERSYGSFTRAFTLPQGVDSEHANAELKEGVLTLVFPKKKEAQSRKIEVGAKGKAKA